MKIKYLFLDVDGTLTDGKLYISNSGELFKQFDIKDGYALSVIVRKYGIEPVVITGRSSAIVSYRCKELGINLVYQGASNKMLTFKNLIDKFCINLSEVAYIGDDLNDLEIIDFVKENGGFTGCPFDASPTLKELVQYVCSSNGGNGAVREFVEKIVQCL